MVASMCGVPLALSSGFDAQTSALYVPLYFVYGDDVTLGVLSTSLLNVAWVDELIVSEEVLAPVVVAYGRNLHRVGRNSLEVWGADHSIQRRDEAQVEQRVV